MTSPSPRGRSLTPERPSQSSSRSLIDRIGAASKWSRDGGDGIGEEKMRSPVGTRPEMDRIENELRERMLRQKVLKTRKKSIGQMESPLDAGAK